MEDSRETRCPTRTWGSRIRGYEERLFVVAYNVVNIVTRFSVIRMFM